MRASAPVLDPALLFDRYSHAAGRRVLEPVGLFASPVLVALRRASQLAAQWLAAAEKAVVP